MKVLERTSNSIPDNMFITVKFGNNESLLCNPSCAVINLLSSIKRRAGYGNTNVCLDLTDETGLVKDLDQHKYDYATKFLTSHGVYILVEKQQMQDEDKMSFSETDGSSTPSLPSTTYIPLLEKYAEIFPNFQLRAQQIERKSKSKRQHSKSPSPAGIRGNKQGKGKGTGQQRTPSRKR